MGCDNVSAMANVSESRRQSNRYGHVLAVGDTSIPMAMNQWLNMACVVISVMDTSLILEIRSVENTNFHALQIIEIRASNV